MHSLLPYLAGLGCSICYGVATILEQIAAQRQTAIKSIHISHFKSLVKQMPFILGIVLDLIGWGLLLIAARTLPLFLVLSFVAFSLVIAAIVSQIKGHTKVSHAERLAILAVMIGIIMLGLSAKQSSVSHVVHWFKLALEVAPILLGFMGAILLKIDNSRYNTLALSALTGLTFGGTGVASRILDIKSISLHVILQPLVIALIAYATLGMLFLAAALQRDNVNRVNSILFSVELAVPSLLGLVFLGDKAKSGRWPLIVIGFLFVLVGTIIVALDTKTEQTKN